MMQIPPTSELMNDSNKNRQSAWREGPLKPTLGSGEVHIWRIDITQVTRDTQENLRKTLSHDEIIRVNRFYFEPDRERFLIGRGGIREILSRYLEGSPAHIAFDTDEFGKPFLKGKNIFFNLSHSKDRVIFAISKSPILGIDIEYCKPKLDFLAIAKQFCSEAEFVLMSSLPADERSLAFYRCWTRKEAWVKALGRGLSFPIKQCEVSFVSEKASLVSIDVNTLQVKQRGFNQQALPLENLQHDPTFWNLKEIELGHGWQEYIAALAIPKDYHKTFLWDWVLGKRR